MKTEVNQKTWTGARTLRHPKFGYSRRRPLYTRCQRRAPMMKQASTPAHRWDRRSAAASLAPRSPAWVTPAEATPDYRLVFIRNGAERLLIMFNSCDPNSTAARRSTHFDLRDAYRQKSL